jgi:hypothetical protein
MFVALGDFSPQQKQIDMQKICILARQNGRDYSLEVKGLQGRIVNLKFAKKGNASKLKVSHPMCRTILKHSVEVTKNGDVIIERLNLHALQNVSIAILGSLGISRSEIYKRNLRLYKPFHIELKELFGSIEVEYKTILS